MAIMQADRKVFDEVLAQQTAVVVDFYADWCPPCKMMSPLVDKLAAAYADRVAVLKINTDEERELAQHFGIQTIPTILFFKAGKQLSSINRVVSYADLQKATEELLH